jgi:hypothetical protein
MLLLIRRIFRRKSKISDLVRTKSRVSYPRSFRHDMVILAREIRQQTGKIE